MHHSTIWWVCGFCSMRNVGSSAASRVNPTDSLSSSVLARGATATGSSGSGMVHGFRTNGSPLSDNVSPVSARVSLPIAQMSPATTDGAGRCCLPSGKDRVPMRSSSSWSGWPEPVTESPDAPKNDEKWPDTCTVMSGLIVPENTRVRLTLPT